MAKVIKLIIFLLFFLFLFPRSPIYAAVTITVSQPASSVAINEEFNTSFNTNGLEADTQYYGKIRLGTSGTYTKGETKNGDTWLGDTDSWTSFPTFTSDSSGNLNSTLVGRAKSTATLGENQLFVRLRKVGASANISPDGETVIDITQALTPTPTPSPTPTPTPVPTVKPTPTSKPTSIPLSTQTKTPTPKPTFNPSPAGKILTMAASTVSADLDEETASSTATVAGVFAENTPASPLPNNSDRAKVMAPVLLGLSALAVAATAVSLFWIQRKKASIIKMS